MLIRSLKNKLYLKISSISHPRQVMNNVGNKSHVDEFHVTGVIHGLRYTIKTPVVSTRLFRLSPREDAKMISLNS